MGHMSDLDDLIDDKDDKNSSDKGSGNDANSVVNGIVNSVDDNRYPEYGSLLLTDGTSLTPESSVSEDVPLVLIDFDGVLNTFLPDKVRQRGGQLSKYVMDNPRLRELVGPETAFVSDSKTTVRVPDIGRIRLHWSSELAAALSDMNASGTAEIIWLSTWQPDIPLIDNDKVLNLAPKWRTAQWYDTETRIGIHNGKYKYVHSVLKRLNAYNSHRKVVWIDDDECDAYAKMKLMQDGLMDTNRLLMVRPDPLIGISRSQFADITKFIAEK